MNFKISVCSINDTMNKPLSEKRRKKSYNYKVWFLDRNLMLVNVETQEMLYRFHEVSQGVIKY